MTDIKYVEEEIEEVKKYRKKTISEYHLYCDECKKEISRYFINNDYHEMDISKNIFSLDDHIGKSHKYDCGLNDIMLSMKFNKNKKDS